MTEEPKRTPGPWTAMDSHDGRAVVIGPDGDLVVVVYGNLAEEGDAMMNARLIAGAPDMAKALTNLMAKSMAELEQGEPWVEALAALTKAGVKP